MMEKIIQREISENENGLAVKAVLSKKMHFSRREISRLKFNGGILLNGKTCRVTEVLKTGDHLKLIFPEIEAVRLGYLPDKPDILYEDEDLVIVNKPAGMPVHPSHEHQGDDLGTLLQSYYAGQKFTIRAVGRLDKDVSGVMCYAKNRISAARLSREREDHILHKTYVAVVEGILKQKKGRLEYHLDKVYGQRARQAGDSGKLCITDYEVLSETKSLSLVKITILTGRTHQIRAGMAYYGHPLCGDKLYGGHNLLINRPALHCAKVQMKQPFTNKDIIVEAPMPDDMKALFKTI